jgi:hypothetical protein
VVERAFSVRAHLDLPVGHIDDCVYRGTSDSRHESMEMIMAQAIINNPQSYQEKHCQNSALSI